MSNKSFKISVKNLNVKKWADLLKENPNAKLLPVAHEITPDMKAQVIGGYNNILSALTE